MHLNSNFFASCSQETTVRFYSMGLAPSVECMYLSQSYALEGSPPPELACTPYTLQDSTHSLSACLPIEFLRDTWTWRDVFSGTPMLATLEASVQSHRLFQAQRSRESNRTLRLDLLIRKDTTILVAAKVLNLPALPQETRYHYEKPLFERHS